MNNIEDQYKRLCDCYDEKGYLIINQSDMNLIETKDPLIAFFNTRCDTEKNQLEKVIIYNLASYSSVYSKYLVTRVLMPDDLRTTAIINTLNSLNTTDRKIVVKAINTAMEYYYYFYISDKKIDECGNISKREESDIKMQKSNCESLFDAIVFAMGELNGNELSSFTKQWLRPNSEPKICNLFTAYLMRMSYFN